MQEEKVHAGKGVMSIGLGGKNNGNRKIKILFAGTDGDDEYFICSAK